MEDQGIYFLWPLLFNVSGMDGPTMSLRSRQQYSSGHWEAQTPLHDKAVVLENDIYINRKNLISRGYNKIHKTEMLQKCVAISVMYMCWFNYS
jgi:hypothetical protein